MRRPRVLVVAILVAGILLWEPLLYPGAKAAFLVVDVFSPSLVGTNLAEHVTPSVRVAETRESIAGIEMRVSWWRPGWGDRHPALLFVNGATPAGNDDAVSRDFAASLARAGYLVMLPEFPFLKEGRLDVGAPDVVDAAFAVLRSSAETDGQHVGIFGASVGAGLALVAASGGASAHADYVAVLGGYFNIDDYVAALASHQQRIDGHLTAWDPSDEVQQRLPPALTAALLPNDAALVRAALATRSYDAAIATLHEISFAGRAILDRLSPRTHWSELRVPVHWIHDPNDAYEPVAEALAARAEARSDQSIEVITPQLLQHAAVSPAARAEGAPSLASELWRLTTFSVGILRRAG